MKSGLLIASILGVCFAYYDKFPTLKRAKMDLKSMNDEHFFLPKEYVVQRWQEFKQKHGLFYPQRSGENEAFVRFSTKLEKIEKHNKLYKAGLVSYKLSADYPWLVWSDEEFRQRRLGLKKGDPKLRASLPIYKAREGKLPQTFDWRHKKPHCMTPVGDQGDCGSCYIFSAAGTLEMTACIHSNHVKDAQSVSVQMFLDCAGKDYKAEGCNGGFPEYLFKYSHDNRRADSSESYPYVGVEERCKMPQSDPVAIPKSVVLVEPENETALQEALVESGPIAVYICATDDQFQYYAGGLYDNHETCEETDHAMIVVGYTEEALILKNSWNATWGEDGYMRLARGVTAQRSGVFDQPSFPVL